jgi:23S rRNA pseudouridine2605 synthase
MYITAFLSRAGICSRRKAVELVKNGLVQVNGILVLDPAYNISAQDKVVFRQKEVTIPDFVYVLLNKPTGCITTMHDEKGRKTVFDYVKTKEKVFPVGRLDRDTSGLLLFTNDGELAHQLMHPRLSIEKEYHVILDQLLRQNDFTVLQCGVRLPDGYIRPDQLYIVNSEYHKIGIVIHSGKKRIIRRLFAHLGYKVIGLDRVRYATLYRENLKQGQWRELSLKEVNDLKKLVSWKYEKK